ncbi:acyl carrier protein [Sulfitobacter sp.]|jgi:acyl carrier protein|uniref:acyl carrier protein n=1 Tax=Sulfitobacter sp. TaxID=1903071 RepID=UPI003561E8A6|tara:strand:+ start:2326 stop:2583 length:258 start_codon:yes stop_codon:yes gene_type:complete
MNIETQVIEIIADQAMLDPIDVTLESTLSDLGIDSMGVVESIFAIEETFDISVPFNANQPDTSDFDISSVASIVAGIRRLKTEQG